MIEIKLTNRADMKRDLNSRIDNFLDRVAADFEENARDTVPVRTGRLRDSLNAEAVRSSVLLRSDLRYAGPVEKRTGFAKEARDRTMNRIDTLFK